MIPFDASPAVMQERQTEGAMGPQERCTMLYAQSAAVLPEFRLFQEMTDQSIVVIAIKLKDRFQMHN